MAEHTVIFYFSFLAVSLKGQTSVIKTQQIVLVEVRGNALLNCQLVQFKDVLQITWQKFLAEGKWNLASYHKTFGKKVNPDFLHKMEFKYAGLQNSSLVIKNVTEQDEGCYGCLFDIQHQSPLRGRTCIQVYELHEPVVDVRESNSTAEWVVSCSATGRPAPTVTLSVSQQHLNLSQYNTVSVSNSNATFTVTTTAVLSGSHKHSTQVGCAARVLSAPHREVMVTIPEVQQTSANVVIIIVIAASVLVVCGCAAVITVLLKKKSQSRLSQMDLEMSETPKTTSRDAHRGRGHLLNSELRQRTPLQKNVDQC